MPNSNLRGIGRGPRPGFTPTPKIDPEAEIIPDWKRTRDKIASPGDFGGTSSKSGSYKRGGKIKKTGIAKVHKGERVLTPVQAKALPPRKLRAAVLKMKDRAR